MGYTGTVTTHAVKIKIIHLLLEKARLSGFEIGWRLLWCMCPHQRRQWFPVLFYRPHTGTSLLPPILSDSGRRAQVSASGPTILRQQLNIEIWDLRAHADSGGEHNGISPQIGMTAHQNTFRSICGSQGGHRRNESGEAVRPTWQQCKWWHCTDLKYCTGQS